MGSFGDVVINGTLSPRFSPDRVVVDDNLVMDDFAVQEMELADLAPGGEHDEIEIIGDFLANGTLTVTRLNGFDLE